MSKLIVTPKGLENFDKYLKASIYLIGNRDFCVRYPYSYSKEEIISARRFTKENGKELFINVNKVFLESDLKALEEFLVFLKEIDVDGLIIQDYGAINIASKLGLKDKCIFYHETFPLNSLDLDVLLSLGIKGAFISKEMEKDILTGIKGYKNVGITVFGHLEMFYSRRNLVTAYFNNKRENGLNYSNNYNLAIKEMTRDNLYPIYEDSNGVNIFTSHVYCLLKQFKELKEMDIEYFLIDSIFLDLDYELEVLSLFNDILNDVEVDLDSFYQNSKYPLFTGFFESQVGLIDKEK